MLTDEDLVSLRHKAVMHGGPLQSVVLKLCAEILWLHELWEESNDTMLWYAEQSRRGGLKGGPARAKRLSPERRSEIAKKAAEIRWKKRSLTPISFNDDQRTITVRAGNADQSAAIGVIIK